MMPRSLIAVVGPGEGANAEQIRISELLGRAIAERGWVTLTGGRAAGVMAAATRGAATANGLTIGLLPGATRAGAAPDLDVALATGLGEARNAVIATAADGMVACGMNPGTLSEVSLALRARKPVAILCVDHSAIVFLQSLGTDAGRVHIPDGPQAAVDWLSAKLDA
jgi:uncharacterized protein (TIGR00725 family)